MATNLDFSKTNTNDGSCKTTQCKCGVWWDLLQQEAYIKLSHKKSNGNYHLEELYEQRARRIAAVYAKFYLETEGWGKPSLRGRYYWMGLGAFASKTVADTFNRKMTKTGYAVGMGDSVHVFARGNLWLYMDIAPWHWCWSASQGNFNTCKNERSSDKFTQPEVISAVKSLPWADEALPKMNKLALSKEINTAFTNYLAQVESLKPYSDDAKDIQLQHLMQIAIHEQRNVLQKICWNDSDMIDGAKSQRRFSALMPLYMLFHHGYDKTKDFEKKQRQYNFPKDDAFIPAPDDMIAENYDSRMVWIVDAAKSYHRMMQGYRGYMEGELQIMAGWEHSGSLSDRADGDSNDPN